VEVLEKAMAIVLVVAMLQMLGQAVVTSYRNHSLKIE
jgi:hypothetical protein